MKKNVFTLVSLFCFTGILWGQKKFTYLGFELGPKYEIFHVTDQGGQVYTSPYFNQAYYGVFLEQELPRNFSLSVGAYKTEYGTNYRFKSDEGYTPATVMRNSHFNLKMAYTYPLKFGVPEIRITPYIGGHYVLNQNFGNDQKIRRSIAPNLSNYYTAQINTLSQNYMMLESGVGLDFMFLRGLTMSLKGYYVHGFKDITTINIDYHINPLDPVESTNAKVTSAGSFYGFSVGLKYPVSRFWQKLNQVKPKAEKVKEGEGKK